MFCKVSILVTLLAASAQLVAANTPACLLAAINTQNNPSDIKAVCNKATDVEHTISSTCGGNTQAAMAAFKSVCQNAGVSVSVSATGTASATGGAYAGTSTILYTSHFYDSSCSCTKATLVTGTAYVGPSGIATGTSGINGTVPAQATGAASGSGASAGSAAGATGASGSASATGSAAPTSTGAAGRVELTGLSMGALAVAGLAMVL